MSKLTHFAKNSSLNCEQLKTFVYSKETLDIQYKIIQELRKWSVSCSQSLDYKQIEKHQKRSVINFLNSFNIVRNYKDASSDEEVTVMLIRLLALFDPSASILIAVSSIAFRTAIKFMGTRKHMQYYDAAFSGKLIGAFCLTEVGHGSNIKLIQTTATYDNINDEFVINTPTFEAAKCWSENLGILATHIILYARLITPDGQEHGLHGFIVSIRNTKTLLPHPGITISSLGEKFGFNGSDHGFLVFNNYRIPHEGLLNKFADVTKDGVYSMYKDEQQQLFTSFAILATQRISLITTYSAYSLPITLTLRYATKSLGNQSYQYRLIPYVAMVYVEIMFAKNLREMERKFIDCQNDSENVNSFLFGIEMLMVTSASKWLYTTLSRHRSRDCFEASKKHAYLQNSALGDIKCMFDASYTTHGDNWVVIQQTGNILLRIWDMIRNNQEIDFPLNSVNFLSLGLNILEFKFKAYTLEEFIKVDNILEYYKWLICYLLKQSFDKVQHITTEGLKKFWGISESQIYYCKELSTSYIEHFVIQEVNNDILTAPDPAIKQILTKMLSLYALWSLQQYVTFFYQGGYASGPEFGNLLEDSILLLCSDLKGDAMSLVDVISLPSDLYFSILDQSNGELYKRMGTYMQTQDTYSIPKWINEITMNHKIHSKL